MEIFLLTYMYTLKLIVIFWLLQGHIEVLKYLLEHGVNINSQDSDNRTPLHWVSTYGHTEIAQFLLSSGNTILFVIYLSNQEIN